MNLGLPLIVIFIFLVIWIVTNVIRAQQDAAQAAARRPPGRPVGASPPLGAQKGSSDIDRFLQEIDRLRKKSQPTEKGGDAARGTYTSAAPSTAVGDRPRSRPPVTTKRPPGERKKPPGERRSSGLKLPPAGTPAREEPIILTIEEEARPAVVSRPEPSQPPEVQAPAFVSTPSRPSRPSRPTTPGTDTISPALQLVQTLFRSQQAASIAIVLHEIFGEPKCRGSRGRSI